MKKIYEATIKAIYICVERKFLRESQFSYPVSIPFSYILYAEDEKCAALIVELSEKYKEDYLREYATYETDLALAKNITIDLLAKSVVIEEIDRVVSWDYLSKRMLFQDFLEYKQLMEKE